MKVSVQVVIHPADDDTEASPVVREVFAQTARLRQPGGHERRGRIGQCEENARHSYLAYRLVACQPGEVISCDYRHGAVAWVEGRHWSCSFSAGIA